MPNEITGTVGRMELEYATADPQRLAIVVFRYFGSIGNVLFVICSCWFLQEANRLNLKKILRMACDSFVVSVLFLMVFLCAGYELPAKTIFKQCFPLLCGNNWFVGCYILFYLLHPAMNLIIEKMDQEQLLKTDAALVMTYSFLSSLYRNIFYYNNLVGFIMIYMVTAYIKRYLRGFGMNKRANCMLLVCSAVAWLGMILLTDILGLHMGFLSDKLTWWNHFYNPLVILIGISAFHLVKDAEISCAGVNYVSGMSLLIYLIHANRLIVNYALDDIFSYIYRRFTYRYELLWVSLSGIALLLFGVFTAFLYRKILQKTVWRTADGLYHGMETLSARIVKRVCRKV